MLLPLLAAEPYRGTVQVDPLTAALGYAHVQVELVVSSKWSVYAGPHLRLYDSLLSAEHEPYKGFGLEAGVRRYLGKEAPEGAWVLVRGVGAVATTATPSRKTSPAGYGSTLLGYTGVLGPGLTLSGGAGVQYIHYTVGDYGVQGVFPALHTAIGWAF